MEFGRMMNTYTYKTTITSDKIQLPDSKGLIGKRVEISIKEIASHENKKKSWKLLGACNLKGAMDDINIRDLIYD